MSREISNTDYYLFTKSILAEITNSQLAIPEKIYTLY